MPYLTQRQYVVEVGNQGKFMMKSGGGITAESTKIFPGGSTVPVILTGHREVENITVSRTFLTGRDDVLLKEWRPKVGQQETSITIQMVDQDMNPIAPVPTYTYSGCVLVGITEADVDSSSGEPATIELEFAVADVPR